MNFIEPLDFIIYQHLNTRIKILPLATSQIARLCNQFNHVSTANFNAKFTANLKALFFYQYSPKIKLFLLKNAKISSVGITAPRPSCLPRQGALPPDPLPPASGGFPSRPPKQPPMRISGYALLSVLVCHARILDTSI